jgi:hypothetical protein
MGILPRIENNNKIFYENQNERFDISQAVIHHLNKSFRHVHNNFFDGENRHGKKVGLGL